MAIDENKIDKVKLKEFAKDRGIICVKSFCKEFLKLYSDPTKKDSMHIGIILDKCDFLSRSEKVVRINNYGVQRAWFYIGE